MVIYLLRPESSTWCMCKWKFQFKRCRYQSLIIMSFRTSSHSTAGANHHSLRGYDLTGWEVFSLHTKVTGEGRGWRDEVWVNRVDNSLWLQQKIRHLLGQSPLQLREEVFDGNRPDIRLVRRVFSRKLKNNNFRPEDHVSVIVNPSISMTLFVRWY